jgi:peroxin-5
VKRRYQTNPTKRRNGNITEAILAFEGAVHQKPDFSKAWQLLGQAQAENDKDDLASMALVQAVRSDPDNQEALVSLAVSYTNDFHKERALDCLYQWIAAHPQYAGVLDQFPETLSPNWVRYSHYVMRP